MPPIDLAHDTAPTTLAEDGRVCDAGGGAAPAARRSTSFRPTTRNASGER